GAGDTGTEARPAPARPAATPGAGDTGTEARPLRPGVAEPTDADPAAAPPRGGTAAEPPTDARPPAAGGVTEARPGGAAGSEADQPPARESPPGRRYASSAPGPGSPFGPGYWARPRAELGSPYEFILHTLPVAVERDCAATGLP
ncbi:hypothetical protein ABZU46_28920, partial [Micromonospora sp. NPDC005197]